MNAFAKLVLVTATLLDAGCSFAFAVNSDLRTACTPWLDSFYQKPLKEQSATFGSYDLNNQYQIFICGNQLVHPPAIYLARPYAKQGAAVVPLLRTRLAQASDDLTIRDIVLVFAEMKRQGSYDASKDPSIIMLIKDKVSEMHDTGWQAIAKNNLDKIVGVSR